MKSYQPWSKFFKTVPVSILYSLGLCTILLFCFQRSFLAQSNEPADPEIVFLNTLYLPLVYTAADAPPATSTPVWDPRLTERGAVLVTAQTTPGEGYWRLIEAQWFDPQEAQGRHHILVDMLDASGNRATNHPLTVEWADGAATIVTEAKPGEAYAANYPMYALAPAYSVRPTTGAPADKITGMGLGTIDAPYLAHHTSYGLVWQWTIADNAPTATPTATLTDTFSITDTLIMTNTGTPTVTPTATMTVTPTFTPTLTATATMTVTPTPDLIETSTATATVMPVQTATSTPSLTPTPTPPVGTTLPSLPARAELR